MSALHLAIKEALLRIEQETSEDWFTIDSLTRAVLTEIRQECVARSMDPKKEPDDNGSSQSETEDNGTEESDNEDGGNGDNDNGDNDQGNSQGSGQGQDDGINHGNSTNGQSNNGSNQRGSNKGRRSSPRTYACKVHHCSRVYQHKSSRTRHYSINHGEIDAPLDTDEE